MSGNSNIAWTNKTWNPVRGCERVSAGCMKCYAEIMAARHSYPGGWGEKLAKWVIRPDGTKEARWTGVIQERQETLDTPIRWKNPAMIFVNSMTDLFHKDVSDEFIADVFAAMAYARQHTFQVLTKRADRMQALLSNREWIGDVYDSACGLAHEVACEVLGRRGEFDPNRRLSTDIRAFDPALPLRNVWLGVSVERQEEADERIPHLLRTPAAIRFISAEPLLGAIDLRAHLTGFCPVHDFPGGFCLERHHAGVQHLNWVIVGGESGPAFRPMEIEHARAIGHQCAEFGIPIFVKQDNGYKPGLQGRFTDEEFALKEYPVGQ